MTLAPGSYNLSVKYFGASNPRFCETFFFMIAVAPLSLAPPDLCANSGALPSVRDLSLAAFISCLCLCLRFGSLVWQNPNLSQFLTTPQNEAISIPQTTYLYSWPSDSRLVLDLTQPSLSKPNPFSVLPFFLVASRPAPYMNFHLPRLLPRTFGSYLESTSFSVI